MKTQLLPIFLALIFAALLNPTTTTAQSKRKKSDFRNFKNEIRIGASGSKNNIGMELQYVREIIPEFAILATVGYHEIETKFGDFKCSDIKSQSEKYSLGAEWRILGEGSGPFINGNIVLKKYLNNFRVRIPEDDDDDIFFSCNPAVWSIFGIDIFDVYSNNERSTTIGFSGKIGYRFIFVKERFSFAPYVNYVTSSVANENILLSSDIQSNQIETNPYDDIKGTVFKFGAEVGIRF